MNAAQSLSRLQLFFERKTMFRLICTVNTTRTHEGLCIIICSRHANAVHVDTYIILPTRSPNIYTPIYYVVVRAHVLRRTHNNNNNNWQKLEYKICTSHILYTLSLSAVGDNAEWGKLCGRPCLHTRVNIYIYSCTVIKGKPAQFAEFYSFRAQRTRRWRQDKFRRIKMVLLFRIEKITYFCLSTPASG